MEIQYLKWKLNQLHFQANKIIEPWHDVKYETKAPLPLSFSSPPPLTRNYAASEHSENIYKLFANMFKLLFRTKISIYLLICVSHCTNQLDSGVDAGWNRACIISSDSDCVSGVFTQPEPPQLPASCYFLSHRHLNYKWWEVSDSPLRQIMSFSSSPFTLCSPVAL